MESYERTSFHQTCRGIGDGMQASLTMSALSNTFWAVPRANRIPAPSSRAYQQEPTRVEGPTLLCNQVKSPSPRFGILLEWISSAIKGKDNLYCRVHIDRFALQQCRRIAPLADCLHRCLR
jgi:hypothetical protein